HAQQMPPATGGYHPFAGQHYVKGYTPPPPPDPKRKAAPASQVHVRPAPGFAGANAYAYPRFHFQFGAIPQEEADASAGIAPWGGSTGGTDSTSVVRKAYRQLALKLHPDKQTKDLDGARFKKVTAAYKVIISTVWHHNDGYSTCCDSVFPVAGEPSPPRQAICEILDS
ncbi:unnamed protein product, partial [Symbiodinium sp. KB8]